MNTNRITWKKSPLIWREGNTEYISIVFTWDLPKIKAMVQQKKIGVDRRIIGGPALKIFPDYFSGDPVEIQDCYPGVLQKYNPLATITSQGCHNTCEFCAVKYIHPKKQAFKSFPILPVVCDDNLLAFGRDHLYSVIDKLKDLEWVDFNQGLSARLIYGYGWKFAQLKNPIIRLAWDKDNLTDERDIARAIEELKKEGIPARNIRCYVLIGYNDTPRTALYRLETLYKEYGIKPNPMRYQKISGPYYAFHKNSYVHPAWTDAELKRFMSYWSNLRYTSAVPFCDYHHHKKNTSNTSRYQFPLNPGLSR
jgi:hypothetical protein